MSKIVKTAVIAGTPVDTQMGVEYIERKMHEAGCEPGFMPLYCPAAIDCDDQVKFQYSDDDEKRAIMDNIFDQAIQDGARDFFIYCNSLSGAFDFDSYALRKSIDSGEDIRIYTPLQVYRRLGSAYGRVGVMAANNLSAHGIEEALMAAIEAILFAMGDSVEIADLAKALCQSERHITDAAAKLEAGYEERHAGIMIQRFDSALQMSTTSSQYQNLIRIARVPKKLTLSDSVIETLSIIAYKQPITKAEIEDIRGVSSDYAINKLISYDLVKELGRKDAPGRPLLFGTTEQFLRSFGVKDLTELPGPDTVKTLEFKEEAEKEVDSRLGV